MDECTFCPIAAGEIDAGLVALRTKCVFVIPALRQHPNNHGHTLVLPVQHTRNLADASPSVRNEIFAVAAQLTAAVLTLYGAEESIVFQNNTTPYDPLFHLHVHVVPRFPGDHFVMTRAAVAEVPAPSVSSKQLASGGHSHSRSCPQRGSMSRVSWDEAFADRYGEWSAEMTADIAFYVALARHANGPLVELAVGNGRVAIPVAQATGQQVIGIDSSPAMLAQARARAAAAGVRLDLRQGDMRELAVDELAGLIYCPFRALLHLPTWADRRRTFERVAASLRPEGRFAWNAFAFDHHIAARLDGEHRQEPVPHTNRYAVGDNRIDITLDGGARSSLWWATKNEWLGLLDVAGLEPEALYGGFAGEPFNDDSREYVFIARRS